MKKLSATLLIFFISCHGHRMTNEEIEAWNLRQKKCEQAVTHWIKLHALYPETYQSLGFNEYSESCNDDNGKKVDNSENYIIFHTHSIKNINGDTVTFSGYFKLEYDYFVDIIDTSKTNSVGGAYPPQTEVWLRQFGKATTTDDSLDIERRKKKAIRKLVKDLKNGVSDNEEEKEKTIKLLDSISQK